ncbi:ATP-binding protein [Prevotella histicola]|uniref:ATP-binding protein n=1 Tax=Prevotella histicola TaxID=470565 RepID=UPI001C5E6C7C|nr:ATP-binding protein [Prevotella histicola]MBW4712814.1 ATP-binding protein [Prevotella histicola]MBW4877572.1 ATP-binding protein [Prevotella histicola]MBW4921509.1 ATP-binding protein [Prevotella histicola]
MNIERPIYLQRLIDRRHNGMIKIITGLRRSGKSYLLFTLFWQYLKEQGIDDSQIIKLDLENIYNERYRKPLPLLEYIGQRVTDTREYFILIDEIQLLDRFEEVLNTLLKNPQLDVYVTGSNARFLSKDVVTTFRGRGDELRIHPLSFSEYMSVKPDAPFLETHLNEYVLLGGLPQTVTMLTEQQKKSYLQQLFSNTYLIDIKERYSIRNDDDLEELIDVMASSIGSLTNPQKIANTFRSEKRSTITRDTVKTYLDYMQDAFLIERAVRYDIKGRKYIDTPAKYYFEDLGLRNVRLNFRQTEHTHLMENLIYNELRMRGYSVDVGQVTQNTKNENGISERKQLEVDFVCNRGQDRIYIQSAYALPSEEKTEQELRSLKQIKDSFQKVVIVGGMQPTFRNDDGILILNIFDFLLNRGGQKL